MATKLKNTLNWVNGRISAHPVQGSCCRRTILFYPGWGWH